MKKRFDTHNSNKASVIDCLDCENYYTGACDANAGGCNAYTPTRKITMSEDIKLIKRKLNLVFGFLIATYCLLCAVFLRLL